MASRGVRVRLFHWWFLLSRPMTLGVRALVRNKEGHVLLVRHSYVPGWYLPGGGIERGQTAEETVRRELLEETGVEITGDVVLLGLYANRTASSRDHVALYDCPRWRRSVPFKPNREIVECNFFAPDALPQDTTRATRERLAEMLGQAPRSAYW